MKLIYAVGFALFKALNITFLKSIYFLINMRVVVEKGTLLYHVYITERDKRPKQSLTKRVINALHYLGNVFENPVRYMLRNADEPIAVEYRNVSEERGRAYLARKLKSQRRKNNFMKYPYFAAAVLFYPVELLLPGPGPSAWFFFRGYGSHRASKRESLENVLEKINYHETPATYMPNYALMQYAR